VGERESQNNCKKKQKERDKFGDEPRVEVDENEEE